jgi:predicted RNA-binding Zn-ribbon protein involved in translation (DUF1610 family)
VPGDPYIPIRYLYGPGGIVDDTVEEVVESGFFGRWDMLPVRYRYVAFAMMAFLAGLAAGVSGSRWATPAWFMATAGGVFLCFYAYPSVWRYLFFFGLIYLLLAVGVLPLIVFIDIPVFIGVSLMMHGLAVVVAFFVLKDVVLQRRAYHISALTSAKEAPYVPIGLWTLSLIGFIIIADISMVSLGFWINGSANLTPYIVAEVELIFLLMYLLEVPQKAFGSKGDDFVPRVSLAGITSETKKVAKRIVKRPKVEVGAKRTAAAAAAKLKPKVLREGTLECPACGSDLAIDVRRCPECYKDNEFAWCPVSEHYIIPCPACGKPTVYGEESCSHCGQNLSLDYKCPECLKATPMQRWERA